MSEQAQLPDLSLPPGAISIPVPRVSMPWHLRLRDVLSAYLPLLLMALLALVTWWLVKNAPRAPGTAEVQAVSAEPDYTMEQFAVERFDAAGRLELRIEGARMRHFPATDRVEIDGAQIRAVMPDGRVTVAHALRAVGNGDGSEVQLMGGAEVTSTDASGAPVVMRSEFLHAYLLTERVESHLPVWVQTGSTVLKAAGLKYDNASRRLDLKGPMRAEMGSRVKTKERR